MNDYNVLVKNANNQNIGEFTTFQNLRFGKRLNNYGTAEIHIPINDPKLSTLVALRRNSIWIYSGSTLVWSGEMALREGGLDNKGAGIVQIHCFDWLEQLRHRFTAETKIYTDTDKGAIAWDLINETQSQTNGNLLITEGTIEETTNSDREYHNDNILTALINLTQVRNGIDIEITNDRVFNAYALKGSNLTDSIVFEYGKNILSCSIKEDFTYPTNRAIILGESTEDITAIQRVEVNDTDSQAIYKVREQVSSEINVSELNTMQEKGQLILQKFHAPLIKIQQDLISNPYGITNFDVGDIIRMKIEKHIYDIDDPYRIYEWSVNYGPHTEKMDLTLSNFSL